MKSFNSQQEKHSSDGLRIWMSEQALSNLLKTILLLFLLIGQSVKLTEGPESQSPAPHNQEKSLKSR
jgi:hypothetical protein